MTAPEQTHNYRRLPKSMKVRKRPLKNSQNNPSIQKVSKGLEKPKSSRYNYYTTNRVILNLKRDNKWKTNQRINQPSDQPIKEPTPSLTCLSSSSLGQPICCLDGIWEPLLICQACYGWAVATLETAFSLIKIKPSVHRVSNREELVTVWIDSLVTPLDTSKSLTRRYPSTQLSSYDIQTYQKYDTDNSSIFACFLLCVLCWINAAWSFPHRNCVH